MWQRGIVPPKRRAAEWQWGIVAATVLAAAVAGGGGEVAAAARAWNSSPRRRRFNPDSVGLCTTITQSYRHVGTSLAAPRGGILLIREPASELESQRVRQPCFHNSGRALDAPAKARGRGRAGMQRLANSPNRDAFFISAAPKASRH